MRTAVITVVHGRGAHLRRQLEGLASATLRPDMHIVVALGDSTVAATIARLGAPATVVDCPASHPLPLAMGRNVGAARAVRNAAELLVFLDVDCIPGAELLDRYHSVAGEPEHEDAILNGPVTYLPPPGPDGYVVSEVRSKPQPHRARPAPPDGAVVSMTDYALFWSLSFAVKVATWQRIGGFSELYRGYGAEDTDFGQCAAARRVPMRWVGGAHAFHQYHAVTDPPVDHLDDILRNAAIFRRRWGWWPMDGWLSAFADKGLISRDADGRPVRAAVRT
ncbi:glycosyltransferase family 2 protein [Mycobacterium colombiense]|uniref:glycosyltransferase family 2 protein n=1 Tax=Mycobacterium colombiense TaxID=339268 RepID=UPI00096FA0F8|nr:galactosyltransferase-related protein [Mycobacterium colombiense]OMC19933.1 sugar transferase [Mycobacterium colombiense]